MNRPEEIILHLERVDQLIEPCPTSPFLKRRLREDGEKFILKRATALPRKSNPKLTLFLPEREAADAHGAAEAFRQHFVFRREEAETELRRIRRFGWRSLLIALLFLGAITLLVEVIKRYLPAGHMSSVLQEGLTILAWVALWRPGELLLYEWYPYERDASLFGRLERAEIQVIGEARQQVDECHEYPARSSDRLPTAG